MCLPIFGEQPAEEPAGDAVPPVAQVDGHIEQAVRGQRPTADPHSHPKDLVPPASVLEWENLPKYKTGTNTES